MKRNRGWAEKMMGNDCDREKEEGAKHAILAETESNPDPPPLVGFRCEHVNMC